MRRLFAILFALLAVLPHPALLAVEQSVCGPAGECPAVCPCCAAGGCHCAVQDQTPAPQPSAPVRCGDFYPVPSLPPVWVEWSPPVVASGEKAVMCREWNSVILNVRGVPLFVRHCAWLM